MNDIVTINKKSIAELAKGGEGLVFKKEAGEQLYQLLKLKELIEETIDEVSKKIAEAGLSIDPSFSGVMGEKVKAIYRTFGEKYTYDTKKAESLAPFLKETRYFKVDSKEVDSYVKNTGEFPEGIIEKPRVPKLSLSIYENEA